MKLYLAALYTNNLRKGSTAYEKCSPREQKARDDVRYLLDSYHYIHKQTHVDRIRQDGAKVFLDSGAFSAHTMGVSIDLPEYCEYIKRNADIIEVASVLDGIGDPLKTYQNQKAMERLGANALPCFHYGEDERYLDYYIENYKHMTLGGMVMVSTDQLKLWLDRIWERHLCNPDGTAKIKVHGFGLTTLSLMVRYPWYSVDSSSWVQMAGNGTILLPGNRALSVSEKSPQRKVAGQHIDTITPLQRKRVCEMIEEEGFDIHRLQTEYVARWAYNCHAFTRLNKEIESKPPVFVPDQIGLF